MLMHIKCMPVIHARTAEISIRNPKAERMYQMKARTRNRTHPSDVTGVLRDFWIKEDDVKHRSTRVASGPSAQVRSAGKPFHLYLPAIRNRIILIQFPFPVSTAPLLDKVLVIVDDEEPMLDQLKQMLELRLNCKVETFSSGPAAIEALPKLNVGLIITDFSMPEMNGVEFIKKAVETCPKTPFIVITGHGPAFVAKSIPNFPELKCFINKPVRWKTLALEIQRHWSGQPKPTINETLPG